MKPSNASPSHERSTAEVNAIVFGTGAGVALTTGGAAGIIGGAAIGIATGGVGFFVVGAISTIVISLWPKSPKYTAEQVHDINADVEKLTAIQQEPLIIASAVLTHIQDNTQAVTAHAETLRTQMDDTRAEFNTILVGASRERLQLHNMSHLMRIQAEEAKDRLIHVTDELHQATLTIQSTSLALCVAHDALLEKDARMHDLLQKISDSQMQLSSITMAACAQVERVQHPITQDNPSQSDEIASPKDQLRALQSQNASIISESKALFQALTTENQHLHDENARLKARLGLETDTPKAESESGASNASTHYRPTLFAQAQHSAFKPLSDNATHTGRPS